MATILNLHIGRRRTDISVRSDPKWPGMWRVHQGDDVSDMVNIGRAKDAALSWLSQTRGKGLQKGLPVSWHSGKALAEAPHSGYSGR